MRKKFLEYGKIFRVPGHSGSNTCRAWNLLQNMHGLKAEDLSVLSVNEILHLLRGILVVSRSIQRHKETLINYVVENSNPTLSESIRDAIQLKISEKRYNRERLLAERKRKRVEDQHS